VTSRAKLFLQTVGGGDGMLLNRQHALAGIVRCRSVKMLGVVIADDFSVTQHVQRLVTSSEHTGKKADDELFSKAVRLSNHVLHALLPPSSTASQRYNLRHRALPEHLTQLLSDSNFLTRMLYKNIY